MKRRRLWLVLLVLAATVLNGCGAGGRSKQETAGADYSTAAPAEAPQSPGGRGESAPAGASADQAGGTTVIDRKIIQNAQLDVKIKDADQAISAIEQSVRAAGGYVQENRVEGTRQDGRRVHMTVRIPAGSYGSLLEQVAAMGEVSNRREWINDVTEEYLDLDARIKTKETHLEQLRRLYTQGGSIKELMELEQEIARVTGELESLKGRYNFLSNQVAYSTVTIGLFEPGVPTPIRPPQTVWERMKNGFRSSWNGTINFLAELAIMIVSSVPALLMLAVLGLIGWALARVLRRRRPGGHGGPRPTGPLPPYVTGSDPSDPASRKSDKAD